MLMSVLFRIFFKECCIKRVMAKKTSQTIAIIALLLNILVIPGLGTIIAGKVMTGILQLVFFIVGLLLVVGGAIFAVLLIGIPFLIAGLILMFTMWVWSIVSGVRLITAAEK